MEATGLGGRNLSYPIPWDISIRSDKEGQSVYGPSLAPMEETVAVPGPFGGTQTLQVTALGRSKAAHEILVLHYFGLDSAMHWGRMGRYTGSPDTLVLDQRIDLRGFSAGSFAGLSTLQLLWKIPNVVTNGKLGAIACPPQLIVTPPVAHTLHLLHYEADQLCVWKPGQHQLDQLQIRLFWGETS